MEWFSSCHVLAARSTLYHARLLRSRLSTSLPPVRVCRFVEVAVGGGTIAVMLVVRRELLLCLPAGCFVCSPITQLLQLLPRTIGPGGSSPKGYAKSTKENYESQVEARISNVDVTHIPNSRGICTSRRRGPKSSQYSATKMSLASAKLPTRPTNRALRKGGLLERQAAQHAAHLLRWEFLATQPTVRPAAGLRDRLLEQRGDGGAVFGARRVLWRSWLLPHVRHRGTNRRGRCLRINRVLGLR